MRYFFCDQSLVSYSGHCYEYFRPLVELARSKGDEAILIGNRSLEVRLQRDSGALPLLTFWCDEQNFGEVAQPVSERANVIRDAHELAIGRDFLAIDRQFRFRPSDCIVLNSARHWVLRGIFQWLNSVPVKRRPKLILLLHFTAFPVPNTFHHSYRHYVEAFEYLESNSLQKFVHILADSEELVAEYKTFTTAQVDLAPIPHAARAAPILRKRGNHLTVGYVGEARVHKGFHLLPYTVERLNLPNVHFHIHAFCHDQKAAFLGRALAGLVNRPNVTLYSDQMGPSEYEEFLDLIDIALIPYSLENYYRQTSGVYAEAVGMAKPVVVSRGTWMATQVEQYGGGETCIADDFISLTDAVRRVALDFDRYADEAFAASQNWHAFHTPDTLMSLIVRGATSEAE